MSANNIVRVTRGTNCFILIGTHNGKEEKVAIPDSEFRGVYYKYHMDFHNKFRQFFPRSTTFEYTFDANKAIKQIMEFNRIDT